MEWRGLEKMRADHIIRYTDRVEILEVDEDGKAQFPPLAVTKDEVGCCQLASWRDDVRGYLQKGQEWHGCIGKR